MLSAVAARCGGAVVVFVAIVGAVLRVLGVCALLGLIASATPLTIT